MRRDCGLLPREHERLEQHPGLLVVAWGVLRSQRSRAQLVQLKLQQLRMYEYNKHNESLFSGAVGAAQHINMTTLFSGVRTVIRHLI